MSPTTIAELRASGWVDRPVKEEIRTNLITRMRRDEPLFPGIIGFDHTVTPALERAILAGHDLILLGERGQAKTRMIRQLVDLLDEQVPSIESCEINDSPYAPICTDCRARVAADGEAVRVRWVGRDERFHEKLATPDTAVADLIGDVDPIKVAEGKYLADTSTIHFGLVPRSHRGIFSVNELPDLPTRIQVSLLNVLEERDVQIRGYSVRLPLDLMLVATANPEDYTNRGRIITPLKDRFGSEIRTHYPHTIEDEVRIMEQESRGGPTDPPVTVPAYLKELLATFTHAVRESSHVNQRSGVSVRFSVANLENLAASAVRRALRNHAHEAVARPSDLPAIIPSSMGRIEFDVFEEGREQDILERLLAGAALDVFRDHLSDLEFSDLLARFEDGLEVEAGDLVDAESLLGSIGEFDSATIAMQRLGVDAESPAHAASVVEFILEGLHLTRRLNKSSRSGRMVYDR